MKLLTVAYQAGLYAARAPVNTIASAAYAAAYVTLAAGASHLGIQLAIENNGSAAGALNNHHPLSAPAQPLSFHPR